MSKIIITIILLLVLIVVGMIVASFIGKRMFDRQVAREVTRMFESCRNSRPPVVTEADVMRLPEPVQRWLRHSQVIGKEPIVAVRLKQTGEFRTKPNGAWMPFEATEYYTVNPPAFIWYTDMNVAPLLSITGRDRYENGRGNMLIKVMSLFTIADAVGPEMDQGTLVRFLNEIMWFPSAALSDYIQWRAIDANSAEATMSYKGVTASALFSFNERGEPITMSADRYMDAGDGTFRLEKWETPITGYREISGLSLPTKGEGVWRLESGDFAYVRLAITEIEYNNPTLFE